MRVILKRWSISFKTRRMKSIKWLPTGVGTFIDKSGFVHIFVNKGQEQSEFIYQSEKQAEKL